MYDQKEEKLKRYSNSKIKLIKRDSNSVYQTKLI